VGERDRFKIYDLREKRNEQKYNIKDRKEGRMKDFLIFGFIFLVLV